MDKKQLKTFFKKTKGDKPLPFVLGMVDAAPMMEMHKSKNPRALSSEFLTDHKKEGMKDVRFGTAKIDPAMPKRLIIQLNKPLGGLAAKLPKALKGTGMSKVILRYDDGTPEEAAEGPDEPDEDEVDEAEDEDDDAPAEAEGQIRGPEVLEDEPAPATQSAQPAAEPAEPPAPEGVDFKALTAQLSVQVRKMIAFVDDKEKFKKLRAMADKAQKAIKDSQDEAVEFVYELEMEIEGGSSTSETQTSSSEDAPAQNQSIDTSPNTSTAEPAPASTPQPAQSADSGTDFKALAAQLTGLVKMMIPMKADNPERFAELKVMADEAQKAIKASQDEAVKLVQDLDTAIAGGSSSAAPATASAEPASPPTPEGVDPAKHAALGASPKLWNDTVSSVGSAIDKLKDAIRKDFASEGADVVADIEKNLDRISKITERFDNTLADLLKAAHEATDEAARKQNITKAKSVLAEHIKYAASEPLIAMLDDNPFGVSTDIKKTLVANLQQLVDAVR